MSAPLELRWLRSSTEMICRHLGELSAIAKKNGYPSVANSLQLSQEHLRTVAAEMAKLEVSNG